ncbi:MAG: trypsin-like peptidase domain-containing protein [Candidatus Pacebacteria bacterium]|nr:trypsin-like peptidase domain-containing protein [Candidatus Paceibacterota bacterium]
MFAFLRTLLFALAGLAFAIVAGLSTSPDHVSISQENTTTSPQNSFGAISTSTLADIINGNTKATESGASEISPAKKLTTTTPKQTTTPKTTVAVITTPPVKGSVNQIALNNKVREAIVNIICVTKNAGPLNSISASGVIIDPRGTIITNSHVGQYLLLKDYPSPGFIECTIRTGSPAQPKYTAELLFLPPSWIADNASKINQSKPTGNGEHDYAFLRITGTVHPNIILPTAFSFLSVSITPPEEGQTLIAAGYPAGFLGGITVQKDLYASSAITRVEELFTFKTDTIDLFSLGGSVVAQQGASGGAAVNDIGSLIGIIVTATDAPDTASRDLRAITTSYIIRDFKKESGVGIDTYLNGDTAVAAQTFGSTVAPALTAQLIKAIESR